MLSAIENLLLSRWSELFKDLPTPSKIQFLVMASSPDYVYEAGITKIFLFKDNDSVPFLFGKVSGEKKFLDLIDTECNNLNRLNKLLNDEFRQTLPELILQGKVNKHSFFLEKFIDGRINSRNVNLKKKEKSLIKEFDETIEWLTKFQQYTKSGYQEDFEDIVVNYQQKYSEQFKLGVEIKYFERLKKYARDIDKLPIVMQHGDFWSRNIITTSGGIKVIDWANCEPGNPLDDLFMFTSSFLVNKNNGLRMSDIESFVHCFVMRNWFSEFINQKFCEYFQHLGIDHHTIKLFFPLFLVKMATRERKHGILRERKLAWSEKFKTYFENEDKFFPI